VARKVNYRFPHRLAGDGAGVDANAAKDFAFLNQRDILAGLRGLDSSPLAGRSRADDDQVVGLHSVTVIFLQKGSAPSEKYAYPEYWLNAL
jgi:hypothetical protein